MSPRSKEGWWGRGGYGSGGGGAKERLMSRVIAALQRTGACTYVSIVECPRPESDGARLVHVPRLGRAGQACLQALYL